MDLGVRSGRGQGRPRSHLHSSRMEGELRVDRRRPRGIPAARERSRDGPPWRRGPVSRPRRNTRRDAEALVLAVRRDRQSRRVQRGAVRRAQRVRVATREVCGRLGPPDGRALAGGSRAKAPPGGSADPCIHDPGRGPRPSTLGVAWSRKCPGSWRWSEATRSGGRAGSVLPR